MRLVQLMDEYFEHRSTSVLSEQCEDKFSQWQNATSPERLIRDFVFSNRAATLEFLRQLFLFEDSTQHHAKVTIEDSEVRIEVYTHNINAITELDVDYANVADQIYADVNEYVK